MTKPKLKIGWVCSP